MSTAPFNELPQGKGGLIQISTKEDLIRQKLEDERRRLEKEAGLERRAVQQFHKPVERAFTKSQRDHTTILFGGLTWKHEKLLHGALEGLGYKCEAVPVPNKKAFQLGKEYGNNGQCNPTYFTVGNLVQFVQNLEEKGLTKQEIIDRYVFFTAGACGPCRFGMYEAEYRLALRNAGTYSSPLSWLTNLPMYSAVSEKPPRYFERPSSSFQGRFLRKISCM